MPDERSALISVLDVNGPRQATADDLRIRTEAWPRTSATPKGVAQTLRMSRDLFCDGIGNYDYFVVAVVWSLMAVEGALRKHYRDEKTALWRLINRAGQDALFDVEWIGRLDAARQLRNGFAHGQDPGAWPPGMAAPVIEASHEAVALLYPDVD